MTLGGAALRFGSTGLRVLEFGASAVALGIYSWFLADLAQHDLPISKWKKAVEGLSGSAVLYTIFGILLTLCLGGNIFFGYLAVVLDLLFMGAFIAVAVMTRHGAGSCSGFVNTPLGSGPSDQNSIGYGANNFGFGNYNTAGFSPNLHTACRLNTAVFAVSIINIFLFLVTAAVQILLVRHHQKEKRYGPSPANNYTSGRGGFFKRKPKMNTKDAEAATALPHPDHRTSHETGTTLGGNREYLNEPKYGQPGYGQTGHVAATNY